MFPPYRGFIIFGNGVWQHFDYSVSSYPARLARLSPCWHPYQTPSLFPSFLTVAARSASSGFMIRDFSSAFTTIKCSLSLASRSTTYTPTRSLLVLDIFIT